MATVPVEGMPARAAEADHLGALLIAARRARIVAYVFAACALACLLTLPLIEHRIPEWVAMGGDYGFSLLLVIGGIAVAVRSRRAQVRIEQAKVGAAEERARYDELSGLYNVRHFRACMSALLADSARENARFSLILFDLDNFKEINDRLGHHVGDQLITAIGTAIRARVDGCGIGARPAGDEFAVLLPGAARDDAARVAAEIAARLRTASLTATPANGHLSVSASWGVAAYPEDASDAESLTAMAERALHRAKAEAMDARDRRDERHSQDVFFAIAEAIGRSLDPKDVLNNLCEAVATRLDLDACAIWLVDNESVRPRAYYAADPALTKSFARVLSERPLTRAEAIEGGLMRNQPAYADNINTSDLLPSRYRDLLPPACWLLAVPLRAINGGVLMMTARHERSAPPTPGLDSAIGQLADAALNNARTYIRARRQAEQLSQLAGIGGLVFGDSDFEERLSDVVRKVLDVTGYDMVTLDTSDPTGQRPFYRSFSGKTPDGAAFDEEQERLWREMRPALTERSIVEFLSSVEEPIVMNDPAHQVPEYYRDVIAESGVNSVVVMPINWQGELKGLFYFASYRKEAFDERDVALMHSIAAQMAPSIQVATLHVELRHSYGELKDAHLQALLRLAYAAEARDPYTECHLQRIRGHAQLVARRMGIEGEELEALGYGAVVHDLGKLRVPDSILMNPGSLSDAEWAQMKQHPEWGAEIIGDNPFYDVAREVAMNHHERWDGSGYPRGLQGDEIPLAARVVAIADVYDALTSTRPYKAAWPPERALIELMRMRGKTLCPAVVDVFMDLWREGEVARIDTETLDDSMEMDFRSFYAAA